MYQTANMTCTAVVVVVLCCGLLPTASAGANDVFDAETGYRIARYRAPPPESAPGGQRVDTEEAEALFRKGGTSFVDVMPATGASYDPETGEWRLTKYHRHIPGSVWLPEVGRGNIPPDIAAYFSQNLARLTGNNPTAPLLFYCQADCWMAWNAVKRASALGYTTIYWYPDGIDGWAEWDNPVAPAKPVPVQTADSPQLSNNNKNEGLHR